MIEPDINQQMARFAPSQNPTDPGFDAIEKAVAGMSGVPMPAPEPVDMDIDRAVQDIAAQRKQDMASSLMAASEVNPDEAAQADVLGKRFGVGQDIALRNMAEMRRQAMVQDTERMDLLRKDPVLARYIADREFAAQASDDVGVLSMLRPMVLEAAMLQTQGGLFRVVGAGYERGATTSELGGIGTKGLFGFAEPGDFDRAKELTKRMQALGQPGLVGSAAEMIAQNVGQLRTIGTMAVAGAALGSIAGPAGLVAGGALGATAGVVIGTGTMEAGNLYLSMREEGVSDDAAIPAAIAGGFLNGLIEVVGMKIASAPFKALASKVIREEVSKAIAQPTMRSALIAAGKAYGLQVGGEAAEEGLQEIVAIASEEIAKAADGIDSETSLRDATGRVIEAFAYGGMASALLGGIGPGANLVVDLRRASVTQRQQDFFNGLAENRKESKLAQRNPQGYERFLAAQAQDTPAETIYVDAATARDVLAQSGTTTAQLEELLPGIRERLEQAVETGGDVTIPTSQFGARLANTELGNALLPHMRLSPDAMSATEAQAFEAERQAVVEEARTILAAKQEADAAFVAEAQQVEDEAFEQIRAVGKFTDIEARTIAKLRQAMVVVDAAEAGMTPAQYQRERGVPLQVRGEGMAVPVAPSQAVAPLTANETNPLQTALGELSTRIEEQNAKVANEKLESSNPIAKAVAGIKDSVRRLTDAINANNEVEIANQAWRLRNRLNNNRQNLDANTLAAVEGMLAKLDSLMKQRGIEIDDPIGQDTDDNLVTHKVVSWLPAANGEVGTVGGGGTITQVIQPGIQRVQGNKSEVLQRGEVVATAHTAAETAQRESANAQREAEMRAKLEAKFAPGETSAAQQAEGTLEQAAISRMDADYLAAVERGDMEAAQRMVDEAARASGYTIPVYHFTKSEQPFTSFDIERMQSGPGIWLTSSPEGWYGRRMDLYLNPGKIENVKSQFDPTWNEGELSIEGIINGDLETISQQNINTLRNTEDYRSTFYVATRQEQVKSADPVTYDEQGNIVPLSRRFDITSPKLFEQAAAPLDQAATLDSDYLAAVKRGDMEAAQRMVDEAAKASGYTVGPVYHGTKRTFKSFESNRDPNGLIYFSEDPKFARSYAIGSGGHREPEQNVQERIDAAKAQSRALTKPLYAQLEEQYGSWKNIPDEEAVAVLDRGRALERELLDGMTAAQAQMEMGVRVINAYLRAPKIFFPTESNIDEYLPIILKNFGVQSFDELKETTKKYIRAGHYLVWESPELVDLILQNYDAIRLAETEGKPAQTIAVRNNTQIKSADPVTYDEQGNIVPLSRRFDITSPKLFEQAAAGPARGGFDPRTLNVLVGKGGDVSTLSHELIHLRIAEYLRMARSATPPARVMDDLDTLFVFMGVEGATPQERLDNYETMMIERRKPLEEKVTYNFEIYLYEGKAPSVELRGVFDRLSAWMRRVYKSIRDDLNTIYRREFGTDLPILTSEVRSVFDRMLASEEQIKRQEAISGMKGLFQTQAESGMADAEWAAYQAMQQEATDAAVTDLNTASMRQLQWLGNARARILRDLQKKHEAKRKEVTAEVAATVKVEPVYRAMTYLRYGRFVDTDGAEVEVEGTHRLDIEKVRAMYAGMPSAESVEPIRATGMAVPANVRPDITPLGTGKYGMLGRDGLDPDVVAETFGYGSGDEMVRALLAAKPMKEAVAERTDAEMLRRFGEMNTPAALEAEVQKALHNEARARFVAVELRHIAKATQPVRVMLEAAKQVAADMISDMTVREVRPSEFVAAESRAARDATQINSSRDPVAAGKAAYTRAYNEAAAVGAPEDVRVAGALAAQADAVQKAQARIDELRKRYGADPQQALIRAKRAQLYQNQLAAEALRVKEYVDKQVKYLRGVMRDSNVKRMGAAAADQIAGLLERFEVAQVSLKRLDERRTMAKYLADLEAAGVVPDIAEEITDEARRVNYKELKVSEFRDLVDAVRQIEHIGKNEQKMRLAEERAAFEEVRDQIVTRIRAVGKVRELQIDPRTPLTGIGRTAAFLRGFAAQHLKAASIARILDGGKEDGPLWNTIIRTANDASDMETRMRAEASLKLGEILKPVFALGNMGGKGMFFPSIGRSLNREARISIALNLGNDGNRQRLLDGEGWTMEKLQPVLESLTEAEWMAVQQVWDFIDGYRPEIAAKERRLYGKEPTWVTPVPFTVRTSDGKEVALQGGYYPVKYDPVASDRVATVDAAEDAKRELQGAYTAATTRRSFVKARAKEVRDRPLLYTLDAAFSGVNDVIHDLSWHEWLISTNRLLRDTQFANAVRETRGPEFLKQLRDWSKDNATGARGQQVAGESVLSWLRQGISASGLGFNVVSAAMQVTGFNQSIVRIGAKYVGQGIVQFSTSPFESSKMVAEKSSFMAERGRTQFREINEIKNRVRGQTEVARRVTAGTYFLMMNMQRSVDIPTWLGAYQKALDAGKDDAKAVALADQAVRDSQGSGLVSDLAAVERGGPAMKLFTVFYSYMNTVYNMTAVQTMTARSKGKLAADYAMLLVVPVVLGYAIKSVIQPDAGEDELDPEALARKLAAEELSYLMGTMVIVREFGGAAQLMTGAEGARMGYGGPAGLRAVGEVYGLATQAGQLEFDRAFRRAAINTLGAFTGLPSAQVNRTIDGIEALVEGEVTGPTAVLAPLTGVQR